MKNTVQIFLLVAVLLFPVSGMGEASLLYDDAAQIQPAKEAGAPFTYPDQQPDLFAISHQPESAVNQSNRIPQPHPTNEREIEGFGGSPSDLLIRQQLSIYLYFSRLIKPSFSIFKLIYPFHFFM